MTNTDPATMLRVWMAEKRVECKELATKLCCAREQISAWRIGRAKPRMVYRQALERETDGQVPVSAWEHP